MKKIMAQLMGDDYAWYAGLSRKDKARGWYWVASLCLLVLCCDGAVWLSVLLCANFINSCWQIGKVKV